MISIKKIVFLFIVLFAIAIPGQAQNRLYQNYSQLMEIKDVTAMEASSAHLYVLSEKEGMAVFRTYSDSVQWLYTSAGMQRRGNQIMADIRFAYLFGDSRRLTVLEPTSVLGVYSSTMLPEKPNAAARISNNLYVALGKAGLGFLSLETPETVDSDVRFVAKNEIKGASVLDVKSTDRSRQLFVLTDNPSLLVFNYDDDRLVLSSNIPLKTPVKKLFIDDEQIWGSTSTGAIFEITSSGIEEKIGEVNEPVQEILNWQNWLFIRSESGRIWTVNPNGKLNLWKKDPKAGNLIADSDNRLWIAENNNIIEVLLGKETTSADNSSGAFKLKKIPNQVLTYPSPLILALQVNGNIDANNVDFSYRSSTENATIRKQGFYWQPNVTQVGTHWFNIIATTADGQSDSTRFTVDVRSFNAPPRFSPVRTTSIAVNEPYSVKFMAIDPEHPQNSIIRYIGVDLPKGASVNEQTGEFKWTPSERQIGESSFKVIATDKLGAASSIEITLRVLDISRGN